MGQREIIKYLKKHKGWRTVREISNTIKSPKSCIQTCLNQMLKYKEVYCKQIKIIIKNKYMTKRRNVNHWKLV